VPTLDPATVEALCLYDWPFNVRELERVAAQVWALHGDAKTLLPEHLPERLRPGAAPDEPAGGPPAGQPAARPRNRKHVTLAELLGALRTTEGNVTHAARRLGISRQKAYRLMEGAPPDRREGN
jgi:transcriptional regulator of acetoin/glycerol metabolism